MRCSREQNIEVQRENEEKTIEVEKQDYTLGVFPSGSISINSNGEYDVTDYASADVNFTMALQDKSTTLTENGSQTITADDGYDGLSEVTVNVNVEKVYTITNPVNDQYLKNLITVIDGVDFSLRTTGYQFFMDCQKVVAITLRNTQRLNQTAQMFSRCYELVEINGLDTTKASNMAFMFDGCRSLETINDISFDNSTYMPAMFQGCSSLSNVTLNKILGALANATKYTGTKTLSTLGLSSAQAETCTSLSNWAAAQAAGWTTGY